MLSRIANSLFWMGRYIERAEHMARYTKVQYISSLDAPLVQSKDFVLESILNMTGTYQSYFNTHSQLLEEEVLNYVTLDDTNSSSITSCIGYIRENARGARDSISTELWEVINKFYHNTNSYTPDKLQNVGIHYFSQSVESSIAVVNGYIDNTLMRNGVWFLLTLGMHIERAIQVAQILLTKIHDIEKIEPAKLGGSVENYQWTTLLKSAEAFDMHKRVYTKNPSRQNTLEFLLFNPTFPKSIAFNLASVKKNIEDIAFHEQQGKGSINFIAGKLASEFQYMTIEEIDSSATEFLNKTLDRLYELTELLESKYLKF